MARWGEAKPSHSLPAVGASRTSRKVTASLAPSEKESVRKALPKERVFRFTWAPVKSPDWSGVKVFETVIDSSVPAGKRSSGTTRRSGSGLGRRAPLSWVVVYRSPSPRTETYLPLSTVTPLTRDTASPASSSGPREISSREMALVRLTAVRCSSSARRALPTSAAAETVKPKSTKLSYKDQRDYDLLPKRIEEIEAQIARDEAALADPNLYTRDPGKFAKLSEGIGKLRDEKDAAELRWLELAEQVEALG